MERIVDYYCAPQSPWTYLGHDRLVALAERADAVVHVKACDVGRVFAASGGLPLAQRPAARRSYRLLELARESEALGLPLVTEPRFFPVDGMPATRLVVACADAHGHAAALALMGAFLRAVWVEERDIADAATLAGIASAGGLDATALRERASNAATTALVEKNTDEAIEAEVFGVPTYIPRFGRSDGHRFWGQDRLARLERALTRDAG